MILPIILSLWFALRLGAQSTTYSKGTYNESSCVALDYTYNFTFVGGDCYRYGGDAATSFSLLCGSAGEMLSFDYESANCSGAVVAKYSGPWAAFQQQDQCQLYESQAVHPISSELTGEIAQHWESSTILQPSDYPSCQLTATDSGQTIYTAFNCTSQVPFYMFKYLSGNCYQTVDPNGNFHSDFLSFSVACNSSLDIVVQTEYPSASCTGQALGFTVTYVGSAWMSTDACSSFTYTDVDGTIITGLERFFVPLKQVDYPSCMGSVADGAFRAVARTLLYTLAVSMVALSA